MREASQKLVGEHDFRNFCRVRYFQASFLFIYCFFFQMDIKGGVTNFRRRILSIDINEVTDG